MGSRKVLAITLFSLMLVSCNTQRIPITPTVPPTLANTTNGVPRVPTKINTEASPLPRTTQSIIPTSTRTNFEIPVCQGGGISKELPDGFGINGTIVHQNNDRQGLYSIGGLPLTQSQLPFENTQEAEVFGFSPNGEWLGYAPTTGESTATIISGSSDTLTTTGTLAFDTPNVELLSSSGKKIEHTVDKEGIKLDLPLNTLNKILGWPASYWINNNLIYLRLFYWDLDPYSRGETRPILYNPYNGMWVQDPLLNLEKRYPEGNVGFSPDMTRVLYEIQIGDHYSGLLLQDIDTNKTIWSDPGFKSFENTMIRWSSDSSLVAVANLGIDPRFHLVYVITRNGEARIIENSTFPSYEFHLSSLEWSPNSRYLAMVNTYATFIQLYIYDFIENRYIYYCPLVAYSGGIHPDPVWSPDNSYIVLSSPYLHKPMQILNVQTGEIYNLLEEGVAIGWSDKFPTKWP